MFCRLAILSILTLSTAVYATRPRANNIVSIRGSLLQRPRHFSAWLLDKGRIQGEKELRTVWVFIHIEVMSINTSPVTGCINPTLVDRLNPGDDGGQYDSSGGDGGHGNPAGSVCLGYNHYVEIVEPAGNRACIRCCNNPADCPTNKGPRETLLTLVNG
ncbi:hypothetical protein MIND_00174100 [Mycena indigotica]|uniref:Uncharacterized protein n=1 Tax=Mycena indigotica TaxID=2126181 RepID=A0A8H6WIW3_9AGAR|nr:uncharacterized protein MIND_00174100 [Mycena indigotica]KAF7316548.1 hypothetical protein MIND_00174100 [Mycena indigotica]